MVRKVLGLDDHDNFTIDTETRQLFWCGNEVVTATKLPWWVSISAIVAAGATALSALATAGATIIALLAFLKLH